MAWSDGYVTDVAYTSGYYRELSPAYQSFVLLAQGIAPPKPARMRYLELGFGQGMSLLTHAAATVGEHWGTDFNPTHTAGAMELAADAGIEARLFDNSFAEFAARDDLPEFDAIGLHGIWSWISPENRRVIVELLRRKLKPGGVAYISYNALPGWAPFMPMRHLLTLHARLVGQQSQDMPARVEGALAYCQRMADAGSQYFRSNPNLADRLKRLSGSDRQYLAHEFFNADWHPMHFSEVVDALEPAKLSFAASASLTDYFETMHMDAKAKEMLNEAGNVVLRETIRDFIVNQQFRRDLFVRGPRQLSSLERLAALRATRLVCMTPPSEVVLEHSGALGKLQLSEKLFRPILDAIAGAPGPLSFTDLEKAVGRDTERFENLVSSLLLLIGKGVVMPAQPPEATAETQDRCRRLNRSIVRRQPGGSEVQSLASPVTGSGIGVRQVEQLFLDAGWSGRKGEKQLAEHATEALVSQGRAMSVSGNTVSSRPEMIKELTGRAKVFLETRLPLFKRLGIA